MKPLIYGYVRRLPGVDDAEEARLTAELAAFIEAEGFSLGGVFIETQWRRTAALHALSEWCRSEGVTNVAVPTGEHLNALLSLAYLAGELLWEDIGGQIWIVRPETEESSCLLATFRGEP